MQSHDLASTLPPNAMRNLAVRFQEMQQPEAARTVENPSEIVKPFLSKVMANAISHLDDDPLNRSSLSMLSMSFSDQSSLPASPQVSRLPLPISPGGKSQASQFTEGESPSEIMAQEAALEAMKDASEKAKMEELKRQAQAEQARAQEAIRRAQQEQAAVQEALRQVELEKAAAEEARRKTEALAVQALLGHAQTLPQDKAQIQEGPDLQQMHQALAAAAMQNAPRLARSAGAEVEVDLPEGLKAGDIFHVLFEGEEYELEVPEGLKPGQTMRVKLKDSDDEEEDALIRIELVVPPDFAPGDGLIVQHDGKEYEVVLPDDVKAGERVKVTLEKEVKNKMVETFNSDLSMSMGGVSATSSKDPFIAALKGPLQPVLEDAQPESSAALGPPTATLGPATLGPANLGPASLGPAGLGPAGVGPASLGPAGWNPASLGPAGRAGLGPVQLGPVSLGPGPAGLGPATLGVPGLGPGYPHFATMGGRPDSLNPNQLSQRLGYPGFASLPPALAQQLGSLRGRGVTNQVSSVKQNMTPDGCILWEVQLSKTGPGDRFGFAHFSGYGEFLRARGLLEAGEATPNATPVHTPGRHAEGGSTPSRRAPRVLVVREIAPEGLLTMWNRAHPGHEVLAYDRIYAVNGKTRIEEMQQELRKNQSVALRFVRYPQMFAVELRADAAGPKPIGLRIERTSGPAAELRIEEVLSDGAMEQFNLAQIRLGRFHLVVLPGMFIRRANQVQGDAASMEDIVTGATPATLFIRRGDQMIRRAKPGM